MKTRRPRCGHPRGGAHIQFRGFSPAERDSLVNRSPKDYGAGKARGTAQPGGDDQERKPSTTGASAAR